MKKIIFATGNQHKLEEIRAILSGFDIISAKEAGVSLDIEETGTTFKENAYIKAKAIWDITGGIVMSDDSGLEVDYIGGEPGVYSSRYMGEDTSYDIKNQNIENYDSKNIYEKEVSQTTVSGNDNVVGNNFGLGNNVTLNGDNNVNSNIVTDSMLEKSNMNVEFPWSELSKQLQQIVNNASVLSEQSIEILKDLLAATEKNSESEFTVIVKENASFFNQQFIKDIISGTLGGVISSLPSGR